MSDTSSQKKKKISQDLEREERLRRREQQKLEEERRKTEQDVKSKTFTNLGAYAVTDDGATGGDDINTREGDLVTRQEFDTLSKKVESLYEDTAKRFDVLTKIVEKGFIDLSEAIKQPSRPREKSNSGTKNRNHPELTPTDFYLSWKSGKITWKQFKSLFNSYTEDHHYSTQDKFELLKVCLTPEARSRLKIVPSVFITSYDLLLKLLDEAFKDEKERESKTEKLARPTSRELLRKSDPSTDDAYSIWKCPEIKSLMNDFKGLMANFGLTKEERRKGRDGIEKKDTEMRRNNNSDHEAEMLDDVELKEEKENMEGIELEEKDSMEVVMMGGEVENSVTVKIDEERENLEHSDVKNMESGVNGSCDDGW